SCGGQQTTLAITQCFEDRTENTDAAIDTVQLAHYTSGSPSLRAAILAEDAAWLSARQPVCAVAFHSGGTIDGINVASCLLDESTARLNAVKGMIPAEATLKATDNPNPSALAWYTTPGRCPSARPRAGRGGCSRSRRIRPVSRSSRASQR